MSWRLTDKDPIVLERTLKPTAIIYPSSLLAVLGIIEEEVGKNFEFAVYVPFEKNVIVLDRVEIEIYKIPKDYLVYIPEQEVSYASVDVEEAPDGMAVIHRHPSGIDEFSDTDDSSINANNDISLLYVSGDIVLASVRKIIDEFIILSRTTALTVYYDDEEEAIKRNKPVIEESIDNIKKYIPKTYPAYYYTYYTQSYTKKK